MPFLGSCGGLGGLFGGGEAGGRLDQVGDGGCQVGGGLGRDQATNVGALLEDFSLSGSVGGDYGESGLQVLKQFVGDGEVAAGRIGLLQG